MLAGHLRSVERLSWRPPDGFFWRPENRTPGSRFHILGPYKIKIVHVITVQFRRRRTGSRVLFSQTWGNFRLIDNLKVGRFLLLSSSRFLPLMFPLILFNKSRGSKHEGPAPTASFPPPPPQKKNKKDMRADCVSTSTNQRWKPLRSKFWLLPKLSNAARVLISYENRTEVTRRVEYRTNRTDQKSTEDNKKGTEEKQQKVLKEKAT